MSRRLCAWAFVALATSCEAVWAATVSGNGVNEAGRRQLGVISLSFSPIDDMTTCEPAPIAWAYSGPPINMTLAVTNAGLLQGDDASSPPVVQTVTLSTKINPTTEHYTWPVCNVTSGAYQLVASIASQNFLQKSPTFFVAAGDPFCLWTGAAGITDPPPTPGIPDPTSSTSTSPNMVPVIVGTVVGVLAAILFAGLAAFLFRRRQRNRLAAHALSRRQEFTRGWIGANSAASSVRTVVGTHGTDKGGGRSDEKLSTISRKNSLASYDSHAMTMSTLPTLHHQSSEEYDGNESTLTHSTSEAHVPPVPSIPATPEEKRASRASLGRKRKPAPVFEESELPPFPPQSPTPLSPAPSIPASMMDDQQQPQSSSTVGHYTTRTGNGDGSDLVHKTSFGPGMEGKKMHYLMPDLPVPSQR